MGRADGERPDRDETGARRTDAQCAILGTRADGRDPHRHRRSRLENRRVPTGSRHFAPHAHRHVDGQLGRALGARAPDRLPERLRVCCQRPDVARRVRVDPMIRPFRGYGELMRPRRLTGIVATAATTAAALLTTLVAFAPPAAAATETYDRPADGVLHLAGHGFGHGHGMSQWGAYGGAEAGKTWRQIVAWYYASPALATKSGTIAVQLSAAGSGPTTVLPATGLTVLDGANHSLVF